MRYRVWYNLVHTVHSWLCEIIYLVLHKTKKSAVTAHSFKSLFQTWYTSLCNNFPLNVKVVSLEIVSMYFPLMTSTGCRKQSLNRSCWLLWCLCQSLLCPPTPLCTSPSSQNTIKSCWPVSSSVLTGSHYESSFPLSQSVVSWVTLETICHLLIDLFNAAAAKRIFYSQFKCKWLSCPLRRACMSRVI